MSQSNVFDSLRLNNNLKQAVIKNCTMEIRPDGAKTVRFRDISGVTVSFDPDEMRKLSAALYELIPLGGSLALNLLASHMLQVAIMTSHLDLGIIAEPPAVRQIELLKRKVSTDFALICALSLAHNHGQMVRPGVSEWELMHSALGVKDDDALVKKFRELLGSPQIITKVKYEVESPKVSGRSLSPESYANLASLASAQNWDPQVVLTLIEEHLSPTIRSNVAFYDNTVSSEEWRQLYDNICKLFNVAGSKDEKY